MNKLSFREKGLLLILLVILFGWLFCAFLYSVISTEYKDLWSVDQQVLFLEMTIIVLTALSTSAALLLFKKLRRDGTAYLVNSLILFFISFGFYYLKHNTLSFLGNIEYYFSFTHLFSWESLSIILPAVLIFGLLIFVFKKIHKLRVLKTFLFFVISIIISLVIFIFFSMIFSPFFWRVTPPAPYNDMFSTIKEDPLNPGTTCNYFSFLEYELPGETVKNVYKRAEKIGYVFSASLDGVESETLEEYNKDINPVFVIKEGDFDNFEFKTQSVKNGIVYSNYYDKVVIEKKVDDMILQIKLKDVYVGPSFSLDREAVEKSNSSNQIFNIKKNSEDPALGDPNSSVQITLFLDFDLPDKLYGDYHRENYLKNINQLRDEYVSKGKAYLIVKHQLSSENDSTFASQAAQCAQRQGKFWEMHDIIFASRENQASLNIDSFLKWAEELKLNIDQYKSCLLSNETEPFIKASFQEAKNNNLYGGPFFLINGKLVRSDNYVVMQYLINQELGIETNYIKTKFSLGALNVCSGNNSYINSSLKALFIELGLDPAMIDKIPLEKDYIMEDF